MRRAVPLLILLFLLAGCAERWSRPGASEAEADATNAACGDEAALAVPVVLDWRVVEGPRLERDRHCWRADNGREFCRVVERWRPARWDRVDVNAPARESWRRQCMAAKGFTFEGYRPLRLQ
jgi:hypothetical protein